MARIYGLDSIVLSSVSAPGPQARETAARHLAVESIDSLARSERAIRTGIRRRRHQCRQRSSRRCLQAPARRSAALERVQRHGGTRCRRLGKQGAEGPGPEGRRRAPSPASLRRTRKPAGPIPVARTSGSGTRNGAGGSRRAAAGVRGGLLGTDGLPGGLARLPSGAPDRVRQDFGDRLLTRFPVRRHSAWDRCICRLRR